ncbi:hypothetical protein AHiyo8_12660 [Arthrobacter sp. Hiyo8]|jgi:hypothetical protein|uniref:hypothetical protein n=1 Tax=Arthrobacter sp. S2(2024) TaxID=3111911 RepID=UPI000683AB09|nr:hypothetical protein AHiyo8_12660 [Arthrobacter sp. Hiyo8]
MSQEGNEQASEAWLPGWLVRHPLYAGWVWTGFWALLIVLDEFLRSRPHLRRVVVGLAHPGLLLVAGLGMSILALFLNAVELTFKVLA